MRCAAPLPCARLRLKLALEQAYGGRWGDARLGWENVKDASGNPTDLWKRPPLIELSELTEFANKIQGLRGAKSFTRAAKCITGVVASPLEVQASMLFGLSRLRGGEGLHLTNNVEIRMTRSARLNFGALIGATPISCCQIRTAAGSAWLNVKVKLSTDP